MRIAAALLTAALALAGCSGLEENDFDGRLRALDGAYQRGKQAHDQYVKLGIKVDDETACNDAWSSSGAKDEESITRYTQDEKGERVEDKGFQELRRLSFINGCLNRPNDLTTPSASAPAVGPAVPTASAR